LRGSKGKGIRFFVGVWGLCGVVEGLRKGINFVGGIEGKRTKNKPSC